MAASSSVVIKVKYGDSLRRFSSQIVGDGLNFTMDELRKKILSLFSFDADAQLMLTYVDDDGDVVTLADDEDLRDVVRQDLNPLRITVKVNGENDEHCTRSSASNGQPLQDPNMGVSEFLRSLPRPFKEAVMKLTADLPSKASSTDRVPQPLQNLNTGVSQILKTVPEPLRGTFVKLSSDLASKASSSAPGITELVDHLAKLGLSYLDQLSQAAQPGGSSFNREGGIPESNLAVKEPRDSAKSNDVLGVRSDTESLEKINPEVTVGSDEVKIYSVNGGSVDESSENIYVACPRNVSLQNSRKPAVTTHSSRKKELLVKKTILNKINGKPHLTSRLVNFDNNIPKPASPVVSSGVPIVANSFDPTKVVSNPGEPKVQPKLASLSAADPTMGDYVDYRLESDDLRKSFGPFSSSSPASCYVPDINSGSAPTYQCPFSGQIMRNGTAASQPATDVGPIGWNVNQSDFSGNVFHPGVRCDGCGIQPITGPRFKSKVKVNYDLCSICFEDMGNRNDYIRMDRPAFYRPHVSFSGMHDPRGRCRSPISQQQVLRSFKVKPVAAKVDCLFIGDVNIFDGTVMAPSTPFTKIWRVRNSGTIVWPKKTQLVWIGGDKMSNELTVEVQIPETGLKVDDELNVAVDFISPQTCGRYVSYWRMALPSGQKFGQRFWVVILVDASLKESPSENVRDLNLNLPPVNSLLAGADIINVELEPMVQDGPSGAQELEKADKFLLQPNAEQELKFPINDSLLVGNGASSSSHPPQQVHYPIMDLSDIAPPATTFYQQNLFGSGAAVPTAQETEVELRGKMEVEEKLLKELEEMGFTELDLNKRMLRMNEYDLGQAVNDLCGAAEWDPILEELQEMGFHDTETNRMLLKKNNGSIKRVVMDLIAGEKIE